jgi:uncharacterized protein (UPF0335 family)
MNDAAPKSSDRAAATGGVAAERLRSFVQRIERLEEDNAQIGHDVRKVYAEAKGEGYDVKVLRRIITLRRKDPQKRREEDELLELYLPRSANSGPPSCSRLTRRRTSGALAPHKVSAASASARLASASLTTRRGGSCSCRGRWRWR